MISEIIFSTQGNKRYFIWTQGNKHGFIPTQENKNCFIPTQEKSTISEIFLTPKKR